MDAICIAYLLLLFLMVVSGLPLVIGDGSGFRGFVELLDIPRKFHREPQGLGDAVFAKYGTWEEEKGKWSRLVLRCDDILSLWEADGCCRFLAFRMQRIRNGDELEEICRVIRRIGEQQGLDFQIASHYEGISIDDIIA